MPVIKDLVPNLNQLYKQYQSIEPWLQVEKKSEVGDKEMGFMNVLCVHVAQHLARAIGGMVKNI